MNRLSDSIIHCVHSKPNGYQSRQIAGQDIFGKVTAGHRLQLSGDFVRLMTRTCEVREGTIAVVVNYLAARFGVCS
jgi:hypothetical protein